MEKSVFHFNSYQICKNWFKVRQGRPLNEYDAQCYQRIVVVLKDIVKLMGEIKTAIEYEHLKKEEIFLKIRDIVIDKLEIQPEQVTCLANFNNDLGADSLEMLEIIIAMEEAFKVEIPDVEAEKLVMVQQAVDYISQIAT